MEKEAGREKEGNIQFVKWFSELNNKDIAIAGGKGASLSEMYNNRFPIPPGFVITAQSYSYFIQKVGIFSTIEMLLKDLNLEDTKKLNEMSEKIRFLIEQSPLPKEMEEAILEAYSILDVNQSFSQAKGHALEILKTSHEPPFVAVRSSATTEDLATASFAGQQDSFLNVKGEKELLQKVKECFSSLFTPRAIYYRIKKGFSPSQSELAVVVQKMIDSEKSGVIFSQNPISTDKSIVIEAVFGLGEGIVSGMIKPDHYVVDLDLTNFRITDLKLAEKKIAITRMSSGKNEVVNLTRERGQQQVLTTYEIKMLAQYAKRLESHYKKPQDIEFAISKGEIFIVQSRPITTSFSVEQKKDLSGDVLLNGLGASPGIASGVVRIVHTLDELSKVKKGDVLVTKMTNPDMVVTMQKACAIVTDEGGVTSHASIVSREMGIPAVVGTGNATVVLKDEQMITVDGFSGRVLTGKAETKMLEIAPAIPTKIPLKIILDLPDYAERAAKTGIKAIGLLRLEGIIANSGKHPLYYVQQNRINDYSSLLLQDLKKIVKYFNDIWIRTSDLRSDEFQHLEGSPQIVESNPMLGDHGIRFSLKHPEILTAELYAIKNLADLFPNKSFGIMIPQVISLEEVKETKRLANLIQMPANIEFGIMVETPAAVQIINSLCEEGISFISFGTNDLTQYMLAIDRNNESIQNLYSEMNPAVLSAIKYVIRRCKKYNVKTSICGQAGSKEEMARFLIQEGIDSISVNADAAEKVSKLIAGLEWQPSIKKDRVLVNDVEEIATYPLSKTEKKESREREQDMGLPSLPPESSLPLSLPISNVSSLGKVLDIEEIVLKALDNERDDYNPGDPVSSKQKDIPPLNEAVSIDSDLFNRLEESEGVEDF